MAEIGYDTALPELRTELQFKPGIRELDGSKSWLVFDPLRHEYFQLDGKNYQMLKSWSAGTAGDLINQLDEGLISLDDIETLLRFLWTNHLTVLPPNGDIKFYLARQEAKRKNPVKRALHGYLFVRIPLVRPHSFLKKTEPLTGMFFSRVWWFFIAFAAITGLFLTSRQWDQFTHTISYYFSAQGFFYFAIALVFVKCLHELGHGYAATRYGCTVKTMGLAFLVLFPVLFTDTTDSWKLTSKRKRLIISAAGVAVEISLAAIATLMWAFLEDGPLRSTAFFVATTSWVMSILVNMNPFMRFDAYYFLSDALGVQNLQSRSFAMGKWRLREFLFGLAEPAPEAMPDRIRTGLTIYAWCTWVYRFFLFVGIALLIHGLVFKPFGSVLAGIEILFFIAIPIMNEFKQWWERRGQLVSSGSAWVSMSVMAGLIVAVLVPWQSTIRMPAVVEALEHTPLYAPDVAQVAQVHVQQGDAVRKGDALVTLKSAELENQIIAAQRQIELTEALLNRITADADDRAQRMVLKTEKQHWQEELHGLQQRDELLKIKSTIDGVVADLDPNIHEGMWVNDQILLGNIVSDSGGRVRGYVSASDLGRIKLSGEAVFIPEVLERDRVKGTISLVDTANAEQLKIAELTSHYDGSIAVNKTEQDLMPLKAWYNVSVKVDGDINLVTQSQRGTLLTSGEAESIASRFWRRAVHVVLREVLI